MVAQIVQIKKVMEVCGKNIAEDWVHSPQRMGIGCISPREWGFLQFFYKK